METSLKAGFAQIFSCCPKNLSCPKFGGAAAPLAPPARTPMLKNKCIHTHFKGYFLCVKRFQPIIRAANNSQLKKTLR